jgi:hypothetical protein
MVMKLKVTVNGDEFSYEGEATITDLLPLIEQWFRAQDKASQAAIDAIAARLTRSTKPLSDAVQAHESDA